MAAERPEQIDRTKTDPDVVNKLAWLKHEVEIEGVIMEPRVEDVALKAIDDLNALVMSTSDEELDEEPGEDVLKNLYHNDSFIIDMVIPPVFDLLERTGQTVFLSDRELVGYAFIVSGEDMDENEESEDLGVGLIIDDGANDIWLPIETPGELQQTWDSSPRHIRQDLQVFAELTKRQIIDRFFDFVFEYANPGAEPIN